MIAAYGGACTCCGEARQRFLTLEHVNHDGAEHRKAKGHAALLLDLKALGWPKDRFTILCMNCNWAERNGEPCPHKTEAEALKKFVVVD